MAGLTLSVLASPPGSHNNSSAKLSGASTHHWYQLGSATWYGRQFAGRRTANGDRFNPEALTCAHRSLPLGSWVKVTNLRNSKSAFLQVNDRGPYVPTSIIDLSFAAARKLGLGGRAPVKLETVRPDDPELTAQLVSNLPASAPLEQSLLTR